MGAPMVRRWRFSTSVARMDYVVEKRCPSKRVNTINTRPLEPGYLDSARDKPSGGRFICDESDDYYVGWFLDSLLSCWTVGISGMFFFKIRVKWRRVKLMVIIVKGWDDCAFPVPGVGTLRTFEMVSTGCGTVDMWWRGGFFLSSIDIVRAMLEVTIIIWNNKITKIVYINVTIMLK